MTSDQRFNELKLMTMSSLDSCLKILMTDSKFQNMDSPNKVQELISYAIGFAATLQTVLDGYQAFKSEVQANKPIDKSKH